mgnify:CR=1 FL=1
MQQLAINYIKLLKKRFGLANDQYNLTSDLPRYKNFHNFLISILDPYGINFQRYSDLTLLQLLEAIRQYKKLTPDLNLLRHGSLKLEVCDHNKIYNSYYSIKKNDIVFGKLPCGSFFCEKCNLFISDRVKHRLEEYIPAGDYRMGVFTVPLNVRKKIIGYEDIPRLYNCVYATFKELFGEDILVPLLAICHPYGSLDMDWKPHINYFMLKYGLKVKKGSFEIKTRKGWYYCKKKYQMISMNNETNFDFNEIAKIYKKKLEEEFKVKIEGRIMIHHTKNKMQFKNIENLEEREKQVKKYRNTYLFPHTKILDEIKDYFRRIPLKNSDVLSITDDNKVEYTTYKRRKEKLDPISLDIELFYNRILRLLPPKYFRNLRLWSLFHYKHLELLKEHFGIVADNYVDIYSNEDEDRDPDLIPITTVTINEIKHIHNEFLNYLLSTLKTYNLDKRMDFYLRKLDKKSLLDLLPIKVGDPPPKFKNIPKNMSYYSDISLDFNNNENIQRNKKCNFMNWIIGSVLKNLKSQIEKNKEIFIEKGLQERKLMIISEDYYKDRD